MAYSGILKVTDGTISVSFLAQSSGIILNEWKAGTNQAKGGAVWSSSQFSDGRQMVMRSWDNLIETFDVNIVGADMDGSIAQFRKLMNLLVLAGAYWMSDYQTGTGGFVRPIWLEARGDCETETRYAYVYDGTIPGLDNPYTHPYKGGSTDTIPVIIEHGVWRDTPPGQTECLHTYSYISKPGTSTELSEPTQNTDVITVDTVSSAVLWTQDPFDLGQDPNPGTAYTWEAGIRFRDVDIPQGATITNAYVIAFGNGPEAVDVDVDIYAEDNMTPAAFSTFANFMARTLTTATVPWTIDEVVTGVQKTSPDIKDVIQEIISNPGWASGNDIAILFKNTSAAAISDKQFAGYNNPTYSEPVLYIAYETTDTRYGIYLPVCMNNYAVGYSVENQTDWVSTYDASATTFSGNLNVGPYPFSLFPAGVAVGDRLYIGSDYPFTNIDFNLVNAGNGTVTYVYKYSTSLGIASGSLSNVVEYPFALFSGLTNDDFMASVFTRPTNWAKNTFGPLPNKYWIVIEITAVTVAPGTLPAQKTQPIYTTAWPFWEVAEDEVGGDINALLKWLLVQIETLDGAGAAKGAYNHVLFGLRHYNRGASYTPYLNTQANPSGISFAIGGGGSSLTANSLAPSGQSLNYTVVGATAETTIGTWTFSGASLVQQYYGRYRVFVRARVTAGASGKAGFRVQFVEPTNSNVLLETDLVYSGVATIPGYDLIDLGYIVFKAAGGLVYSSVDVVLRAITTAASTFDVLDLILFPVDEGTLEYVTNDADARFDYASGATYPGNQPLHDSTKPKEGPYSGIVNDDDELQYTMQTKSLGLFSIPNKTRMRIYFLPWSDGDGELKGTESLFDAWFRRVQQYLNLRGNE